MYKTAKTCTSVFLFLLTEKVSLFSGYILHHMQVNIFSAFVSILCRPADLLLGLSVTRWSEGAGQMIGQAG